MKKILLTLIFLSSYSFSQTYCSVQENYFFSLFPNAVVYEDSSFFPTSATIAYPSDYNCQRPLSLEISLIREYSTYFMYQADFRKRSDATSFNNVYYTSQQYYKNTKFYVCRDSSKKYNLLTKACDLPYVPPVQCSENMKKSPDGTACICKDGYNPDDVTYDDAGSITTINTCKPKKNCPPQMKYFWTDQATDITGLFKTEYYDCVPRTDLSEADCEAQGGHYLKIDSDGESLNDSTFAYRFH